MPIAAALRTARVPSFYCCRFCGDRRFRYRAIGCIRHLQFHDERPLFSRSALYFRGIRGSGEISAKPIAGLEFNRHRANDGGDYHGDRIGGSLLASLPCRSPSVTSAVSCFRIDLCQLPRAYLRLADHPGTQWPHQQRLGRGRPDWRATGACSTTGFPSWWPWSTYSCPMSCWCSLQRFGRSHRTISRRRKIWERLPWHAGNGSSCPMAAPTATAFLFVFISPLPILSRRSSLVAPAASFLACRSKTNFKAIGNWPVGAATSILMLLFFLMCYGAVRPVDSEA